MKLIPKFLIYLELYLSDNNLGYYMENVEVIADSIKN